MHKYQILIEYVGTTFVGWQIQKKGNSIQKNIQNILSKLLKEKVKIYGSGRTDTGVHALEQSAHFECINSIKNIQKLVISLNFFLNKKNISILQIKKKKLDFHARYSAKKRSYIYLIRNDVAQSVINYNREWYIRKTLDILLMRRGAKKFEGTHDFSTFRASNCYSKNPIKTIKKIEIKKNKKLILIRIQSKSFLRNQVRSMVGSLKYLGEGKWNLKQFEKAFKSKKRVNCAPPAPSHGLYLEKVTY